jgi:uracil DNA glycosylase
MWGEGIDELEVVESDRIGAPNRRGWRDITEEVMDPIESDRRGDAILKWGNEIIERPLSLLIEAKASRRVVAAFSSSFDKTM